MEFFESSESLGGRPRREMDLIFATASLIPFHSDSELIFFCELLLNGDFENRSVDNVPVGHLFSGSYSENFFEPSGVSCLLLGWKPLL